MKNKWFVLGFAVLSVLASCSSEDALVDNPVIDPENPETVVYQNSDIPITLLPSVGQSKTTRGIIESDEEDLSFELEGLGVFGLAYEKQATARTALDIDWRVTGNSYSKCLENVAANAVKENMLDDDGNIVYKLDGETPKKVTKLVWQPEGQIYYYPLGGWYKYNFYAYWPRENTDIIRTQYSIDARLALDGQKDIICGRTQPTDAEIAQNAYSVNYFKLDENIDVIPSVVMKHAQTRLRFKAVEGASYGEGEDVQTQGIQIVDVYVVDAPTTGTLQLARLSDTEAEGKLVPYGSGKRDFHLRVGDNEQNEYGGYWPIDTYMMPHTTDAADRVNHPVYIGGAGDGIMLPPIAAGTTSDGYNGTGTYAIKVKMKDGAGNVYENEEPFLIVKPDNGFEAGKAYWIELTINARKQITLRTTLAPWDQVEEAIPVEF